MACGQGQLDWAAIIGTLKEIGYDGSITVEFVPPLDRTPANPYKNAMAAADDSLTPEQLKFIEDHGSGVLSEEFYSWLVEESVKTLRAHIVSVVTEMTGAARTDAACARSCERIQREGGVTIAELARAHAISNMTAHRDLEQLARDGLVERIRGGARALASAAGAPAPDRVGAPGRGRPRRPRRRSPTHAATARAGGVDDLPRRVVDRAGAGHRAGAATRRTS